MAYDQQTWVLGVGGGTALNAVRLNHMEQGIADAHSLIATLATNDHTHTSAQITDATATNTVDTIVKRDATGFIAVSGITGLSTATGSTQAVPKSQLDAAIAGVSGSGHTHTLSQITDVSATGALIASAADATAVIDILDVYTTADADTAIASAAQDAQDAALADAQDYTDDAVDRVIIPIVWTGAAWSTLRPNTTGTNRICLWAGPSSSSLLTNGTTDGGAYAAAPQDIVALY